MCLYERSKEIPEGFKKDEEFVGYKVYKRLPNNDNELRGLCHDETYEIGKTYKCVDIIGDSKIKHIPNYMLIDETEPYGFHVFLSRVDAFQYRNSYNNAVEVIVEVKFKGVKAIGYTCKNDADFTAIVDQIELLAIV